MALPIDEFIKIGGPPPITREAANKFFEEKLSNQKCFACGHDEFVINTPLSDDKSVTPFAISTVDEKTFYAALMYYCGNCGNTYLLNIAAIAEWWAARLDQ